jgi:hypothetical protein
MNFLANGNNFTVALDHLTWIANMTVNNVTTLTVPGLQTINGSATFGSNQFESFNAPNLTSAKSGSLSFIGNPQLTNITCPQLASLGGALLIANNTGLEIVDGFPKLKSVGGAVKLRGNFSE